MKPRTLKLEYRIINESSIEWTLFELDRTRSEQVNREKWRQLGKGHADGNYYFRKAIDEILDEQVRDATRKYKQQRDRDRLGANRSGGPAKPRPRTFLRQPVHMPDE